MASKKTAKKTAKRSSQPDAIALLKADHKSVKDLFKQFESARTDTRKIKIASTICQELIVHTSIEEEILYPAARTVLGDEDMLDEAEVEHQSAKDLIAQIEAGEPGKDMWEAKVKVLGEYIEHHVKEEETEMFPKVRKTKLDLKEMGAQLAERKRELQQQK
ncbi:MAG: hemerythrin domain-containing protein [Steroidobacteraceae bacterium]